MKWSEINTSEVTAKAAAGLAAGIGAWAPIEVWYALNPPGLLSSNSLAYSYYFLLMLLPAFAGTLISATELPSFTLTPKAKKFLLFTFLICFALGLPAVYLSNDIFRKLAPKDHSIGVLPWMLARSVAWSGLGLLVGFGVGVARRSPSNIAKGAIGGLLGGLIGGLFFDPIQALFSPVLSRAFGLGETGLTIGLLIGLVQDLTKTAWLRVEAGRLCNREYRLEKSLTVLGRSEECDVGLFGDSAVEGRHAQIEHRGNNDFVLNSLGHQLRVNGRKISSVQLNNGDIIKIGDYALRFNLKAALAGAKTPAFSPTVIRAEAVATPCLVDASGGQWNVHPDSVTHFGRSADNDVVLPDRSVSRSHATITPGSGGFYLRDLQSQNGTYVDNQRVNECLLCDGNKVQIGDLEFTFRV